MKKRFFSSIIIMGVLLIFLFSGSVKAPAEIAYAASEPEGDITIVDEYVIPDGMHWCTYYVVVAKNDTGKDIAISADFEAKDKSGEVLYKVNDYSDAVKEGQTFILYGQFNNERIQGVRSYDYSFNYVPTDRCTYNEVSVKADAKGSAIEVSATYYSANDIEGVGVRTVFMKNGKAVAFDTVNIADCGCTFYGGSTNSQVIGTSAGSFDDYLLTYTSVD